jgi:iron complex outermembrane recepter protein
MLMRGSRHRRAGACHATTSIALAVVLASTILATPIALADTGAPQTQQTQLSTVVVAGTAEVDSALTQTPTMTPLNVTEPTVALSQYFIDNNMPLTSNFTEIVGISPSVQSVSPNGPGLMENQVLSIRGFVDGYYDVTFDGIPFQDSNDFTHHSTSYFMAHDLGGVTIDYGPGTAATIGDATFCCSVENLSKAPLADATLTPYVSFGSFNTQVFGAEFDTGRLDKLGGAAGYIDAESSSSDGELTNMGQARKNVFAKFEAPVAAHTVLTFAAMYNQIHQYVGLGATAAQIAEYGPTWGLNNDPDSQDYYGYNYDQIHTDFEYVGLQSQLGDWNLDNKVYTYAYYHTGHNGEDPNGETPNGTYWGATDVPGQLLTNNYRSWGDTFNAKYDLFFGDLKAGVWADRQSNERALPEVDETLYEAINPNGANWLTNGGPSAYLTNGGVGASGPCPASSEPATPGSTILQPSAAEIQGAYSCNGGRLLTQKLITLQPYFMVDWNVLPGLTLSPGVRYDHFEREVDATVNVKDGGAESYNDTFSAVLPSFLVHYTISGNWAAYAQAAKGFMAPNENYFNRGPTTTPGTTNLSPQETLSYQSGTTWQSRRLSASADVYYIHFDNEILSEKFGPDTIFFNAGGTNYKGVEANATYYAGMGFSLYANGSINRAKVIENSYTNCTTGNCTGGLWVPNAPNATLAYGVIYNQYGFYASLLNKRVGHTYGDVGETQPIPSYSVLDGALGYTFGNNARWLNGASIKLDFSNILNKTPIISLAGYTAWLGTPLYWTMPERSFDVTLEVPL